MPNQATTFAGARAENFLAVHLNTSQFAEKVTYFFRGGSPSVAIPAIVKRSVIGRQDEQNIYDEETLEVTIAYDPTGASGLAAEPDRGDSLNRTQYGDPPNKRWFYAGDVIKATSHSWTLRFMRQDLVQAGAVRGI